MRLKQPSTTTLKPLTALIILLQFNILPGNPGCGHSCGPTQSPPNSLQIEHTPWDWCSPVTLVAQQDNISYHATKTAQEEPEECNKSWSCSPGFKMPQICFVMCSNTIIHAVLLARGGLIVWNNVWEGFIYPSTSTWTPTHPVLSCDHDQFHEIRMNGYPELSGCERCTYKHTQIFVY